ncbi:MAG: tetraacyldisaccharide 4'-kinase [Kiritimatiellae bacterium]|nr:tetraacyldisaccharide 4'-kinase [Kiritimatiellia bacterium]
MRKAKQSGIERLESYLVRLIQEKGADRDQSVWINFLLAALKGMSVVFAAVVAVRYCLYSFGVLRRYPLGIQVISIGNVTAGGTGKTPVTEIFARTLAAAGRKVAILSRGYRRKEAPWWQRVFTQAVVPPLVVSDGKHVLQDSATGGDEPYMLASNLPGVAVVVDRNRVKAGRYAVKRLGCDTIILDDGFQYQKLKHSIEVLLVDSSNPFGNGNMLPRGILREPASNLGRADIIFLTKCDGDVSAVKAEVRKYTDSAEIVECNHTPKSLKDVWSREEFPLSWLNGKTVCTLSGIASPKGFENSLRRLGAKVVWCERYADHHRYDSSEVLYALNRTADMGADALVTTEKDAVRFPRFETSPVRCLYLRIAIEILAGGESFDQIINRICFRNRWRDPGNGADEKS